KFKAKWWEFDVGWAYIRLLEMLRLARILYARALSAREFAAKYYAEKAEALLPTPDPFYSDPAQ
ncbi:MAG: hypothetical protein HY703_05445, partial [Gemmatimonadetes bacterium]|nr:hypothetical protein [Gemmatimonadota bacterium]